MKPPAAIHSSEDLATSVRREKKPTPVSVPLNPVAPELVGMSSDRKTPIRTETFLQIIISTAAATDTTSAAHVSIHGLDD